LTIIWPLGVSTLDSSEVQVEETPIDYRLKYIIYKTNKKYHEISTLYDGIELNSILIGCNI